MSNLPFDPSQYNTALQSALSGTSADDMDYQYLKMTKAGEWVFGQNEDDVEEGSVWAIDPRSLVKGFIAWDEGEKLGEEMAQVFGEPPISKGDLPDVGGAWVDQLGFNLACTTGAQAGTQCIYKTNSKGGRKAIRQYMSALQVQMKDDPENCVALVELDTDFYKHKEYGRIYNPILSIVDWVSLDATEVPADEDEDEEETPKAPPAKKRKRSVRS